jgi:hypothetical protein
MGKERQRRFSMPEPITLAAVGAVALSEGVKFLYGQAGELLKRWRERRDASRDTAAQKAETESVALALPPVFEGQMSGPVIHYGALQEAEGELRELYKGLSEYASGIEPIDPANETLLERVDALRRLLEAVYQQRITFKGEARPASGPDVTGRIDVKDVLGYAAAVRAREVTGGSKVTAEARADRVGPGGTLVGGEFGKIGD